jgi:hypothetical protein
MNYERELDSVYHKPKKPMTKEEWIQVIATGDYSDADMVSLVAERDALRARLEAAEEQIASLAKPSKAEGLTLARNDKGVDKRTHEPKR